MKDQSIAKNLIYHRKLKGLTQERLAEKTQVTVRTIQRIEKGEVNPHLQTVQLLATALEIEVKELLPLENPKTETLQKKWLLLLHSTQLLGLIVPLSNLLVPLFLWIHKREDNTIYYRHGARVLNFQITISILAVLSFIGLVTIEKWGFLFFIALIPICVLIVLINIVYVVKANRCYYPLSFPFLKTAKPSKTLVLFFCMTTVLLQTSCSEARKASIERLDGSSITIDSIERKVTQLMKEAKVTGMALTVFNSNQPVFSKTFGYKDFPEKRPLSDSTNFYGASFSKAVFSVLVMKLVEEDVIDLDTPLASYLPKKVYDYIPKTRWHDNFSDLRQDSLYHKITARMCLAHTTGFPNYRWFEDDQKLRVKFEPGSRYSYSGEGFIYLQVVLEKLTGKNLEVLAQEKIFQPLGMYNSSYEWKPRFEEDFAYGHNAKGEKFQKDKDNEPRGGGTLETTASDYTKFLTAVLRQQLLSKASYRELFDPHVRITSKSQFGEGASQDTDQYDAINLSYGLGWGYFETPYGKAVFKEGNGSGFQNHSLLFPQSGMGIMIMTNSVTGNSVFKELLEVVLKDTNTPWEWEGYFPYQTKANR